MSIGRTRKLGFQIRSKSSVRGAAIPIRTLTNPSSGPGRLPPMVLSKRMVHVRRRRPSKHDSPGGVAPATDTSALLGGGIALGMSECDVVFRAGAPSNIQIDQNPNGDRTAVLTFNSGPRPGIYHFRGGALTDIERGQITPPPTQTAKKK